MQREKPQGKSDQSTIIKQRLQMLKLYPKPEFIINWENTIISLETNTTSPQNLIARSSTLNTPILYDCSTQIIILEKIPNLSSLCVLSKRKITFSFFPQYRTKHYSFFFSRLQICVSIFSLSHFFFVHETQLSFIYKALPPANTLNSIRNRSF